MSLSRILLNTAAMASWVFLGLFLVVAEAELVSLREALQPTSFWDDVVLGVSQVAERYLAGCHLVIVTPRFSSNRISFFRKMSGAGISVSLVEMYDHGVVTKYNRWGREVGPTLYQRMWGSGMKTTCRALLLDHTAGDIMAADTMLSWSDVWLNPEIRVVIMGCKEDVNTILMQTGLRNTRHAIYVTKSAAFPKSKNTFERKKGAVDIYTRCLYCGAGKAKVQLKHRLELTGVTQDLEIFTDKPEDFLGHTFKMVAMTYFPYSSFERHRDKPGTLVIVKDSLNARMMAALSSARKFTYEIQEPEDRQWGLLTSAGNWTGIIGTLQQQKADFSVDITVTQERAEVVDFTTLYIEEPVVILSSKPRLLPEYLSLVRPFEGKVWAGLVMGVIVWGATLWFLQKLRLYFAEGHRLNLVSSILYGWGLLLEDNPYKTPAGFPGQILVGTWLMVVFIVTMGYRSSLISHLVVQGKSSPIDSMEDLVERGKAVGWEWGTKRMTGALKNFLSSSSNPAIVEVYRHMQTADTEEGMKRVVDGGFSYIYNYYYSKTLIATRFTDYLGYTPIHISTMQYPIFSGNAWAFRRGAPCKRRFSEDIQKLLCAGLVKFWMDDVIKKYVIDERRTSSETTRGWQVQFTSDDDHQVVLGLMHMQTTMYTLLLGNVAATITLLAEHGCHIRYH